MRIAALLLLLALTAGCGEERVAATGDEPTPPPPAPTWPATGCGMRSQGIFDFFNEKGGSPTLEEAAAAYLRPGDRLVEQPPQPKHHTRGWMVVTPDNEIRAVLGIVLVRSGYRVDTAEECAGDESG